MKAIFFSLLAAISIAHSHAFLKLPNIIKEPFKKLVFQNKCMGDLGCFYNGPPFFDPILRPVSLPPFNRKRIKTNFWLYTPTNKFQPYRLEPNMASLSKSPFDSSMPVKFFIHGYLIPLSDRNTVNLTRDALLKQGNFNVIIVDWTSSNGRPYLQAVANARVVGAQVAQLVKFLETAAGVSPKNVHIIGHSLGSHVSGWAGERIPNLGRITGLDPAGPYFRKSPRPVRLDDTDADFVDILHTNAAGVAVGGYGIVEPIGHLDFYPNGGKHQPGCQKALVNFTIVGINVQAFGTGHGFTAPLTIMCDHNRANDFFIESITNENCTFIATECENYKKYKRGACSSRQKAIMGLKSSKISGVRKGLKYYLTTSDKSPFCISQGSNDISDQN